MLYTLCRRVYTSGIHYVQIRDVDAPAARCRSEGWVWGARLARRYWIGKSEVGGGGRHDVINFHYDIHVVFVIRQRAV